MNIQTSSREGWNREQSWGRPDPAAPPPRRKRRGLRLLLLLGVAVLLISTILVIASYYRGVSVLRVQVAGQAVQQLDINQALAVSPYLLGSNVFPQIGTVSKDATGLGFMSYDQRIIQGMRAAGIKLLRFPGGNWNEEHTPSAAQLNAFSSLLNQLGAEGIMQTQLSAPNDVTPVSLQVRATRAALLVEYMNNSKSIQRTGAAEAFHPITYWTVGNEPDLLTNPDTGRRFTVAEYTQAFIAYSLAMHQRDAKIKIFGPETSDYLGPQGPKDATGKPWLEEFLREISAYEQAHSLPFRLLDGVSFHAYPFGNTRASSGALLQNPEQWDRILPALHAFIRQQFGQDLPLAITEINTNSGAALPPQNLAAAWWADTLGKLMSNQVAYVAFFSAEGVDTPYPLFNHQNLGETAMLRSMQLFARLQRNLVPLASVQGPVSVYATQDANSTTVSLLLVNKTPDSQRVSVQADSFLPFGPWRHSDLTVPGYGISVLTLHRDASSEAYRFRNTGQTQAGDIEHLDCNQNAGSGLVC